MNTHTESVEQLHATIRGLELTGRLLYEVARAAPLPLNDPLGDKRRFACKAWEQAMLLPR